MKWLRDVQDGPWALLADALRSELPVPNGFVALRKDEETDIRKAYEELKHAELTHFVAIRSDDHALLDVIGNDALVHRMKRMWKEDPDASLLVQRMVNSEWCGNATNDGNSVHIRANEGLRVMDPDIYIFDRGTGECIRRTLQGRQRKLFRWVDGSSRTVQLEGDRGPLSNEQLQAIAALAASAQANITWALEDNKIWLLGIRRS